jgi:predicted enzyme related to lactoylglutathione lyase
MDNEPTLANGKICYLEIPAISIESSVAFYKDIFGWRIRTRSDGSISFDDAAGQVSGTWTTNKKAVSDVGVLIYIMVYDLSATLELITKNGGKIIESGMHPTEIVATFSDPAGNIFGLYQQPDQK